LDALNFAMHDPAFKDNPPSGLPRERVTRPFDMQVHKFNQSHPDIPLFLEKFRKTMDEYQARFTVAEVGGPDPLAEMKAFTADNRHLHSAYNFDFLYADKLTASLVKRSIQQWPGDAGEGWPSWAFSNHDAPRALTRWSNDKTQDQVCRLLMLLLLSFRGNAFIYQGEELGLPQGDVAFDDLQDPEAITNWPHTLGRDGARTPMPWNADAPNAGFTNGPSAWLRLDQAHAKFAIDAQNDNPASVLNYTRQLLALRRNLPSLAVGDIRLLDAPQGLVAFTRVKDSESVLCVYNLSDHTIEWSPQQEFGDTVLLATETEVKATRSTPIGLSAHSGYWAMRAGNE
jgi:alpha-glucosidase